MKNKTFWWIVCAVSAGSFSSCYYYPVAGAVASAPPNMPYSPYADEKSGSVQVYDDTYVPQPQPVAVPVAPRPAFTLGITLPPIIFGHHHHHHGHHH